MVAVITAPERVICVAKAGLRQTGSAVDAGLADTMHVAVSPVEPGSGPRLWESPDELLDQFHLEVVPSPSGLTHHLFWRR